MKYALITGLCLATVASCWGQDPLNDYIGIPNGVIGIGPATPVPGSRVVKAAWSDDGRNLVILQRASINPNRPGDEGALVLSLYDRATEVKRELMRVSAANYRFQEMGWLRGSYSAFVSLTKLSLDESGAVIKEKQVLRVGLTGTPDTIISLPFARNEPDIKFWLSPTTDTGAIRIIRSGYDEKGNTLQTTTLIQLREGGDTGASFFLPAEYANPTASWSRDGRTILLRPGYSTKQAYVDFGKLRVVPLAKPVSEYEEGSQAPFTIKYSAAEVRDGEILRSAQAAWAVSKQEVNLKQVLIGWDVESVVPSPNFDSLLVISGGVATVRTLYKVDSLSFKDLYRVAIKQRAIKWGVDVSSALFRYAKQNGNELPQRGEKVYDTLKPLVADSASLNDFVYQTDANNLRDITNPNRTELGYIRTVYGRVAIFADGTTMWIDG